MFWSEPKIDAAHQIASALVKMEESSLQGWQQVVLGIATTVLAVAGGYLISWIAAKRHETKQRSLLRRLLHDEVEKRWKGHLLGMLEACTEGSPKSQVEKFSRMRLSQDDLPVCKAIHDRFWEFHFIGDEAFISTTMHVTVLMRDLVDISAKMPKLKADSSVPQEQIDRDPDLTKRLDLFQSRLAEKVSDLSTQLEKVGKVVAPPNLLKAR